MHVPLAFVVNQERVLVHWTVFFCEILGPAILVNGFEIAMEYKVLPAWFPNSPDLILLIE